MDIDFVGMVMKSSRLLYFKGSSDFPLKKCISSCNAKLGLPNNVSGVYLVVFPLLLIGQQGLVLCVRHQALLPIGWRILQTFRQKQGKLTNKTPLFMRHLQQANQLLS
jgi:hypothetical protein